MKYAKFVLQLLVAVVLISSNIAPSIVMADELEQVAEQQQQTIVNEVQAATTNTQDTTPEQTEGTTDFSEQNPNQYAVFDMTTTVKGPTGNNIVSASAGKMSVAEGTTALDAVKQLLDSKGIAYALDEAGSYITSIKGETAGKFGGYDGWMYTVNDAAPEVGLSEYTLKANDKLDVYYSTSPEYTVDTVVATQTADVIVNLKGDKFQSNAKTLTNWVSSNGVVKAVTLDDAMQQATVTLKLRDVESKEPLTLTMKQNATVGKQEQTFTLQTAETIEKDVIVTYTEEEVRQQAEAALQKSKAFMQQNNEALSKGTSSSYSGFWKTAALIAAGINPAKYPYAAETSPYAEGSDWLKPVEKAFVPVNTNAGYVLGAIHLDLDPTNLKTRNFVDDLAKQQKEDGSFGAINNEAFALLALDLAGAKYDQEKHIQAILKLQDETGIFPAWGSLDSTGWALMALAPHKDREGVAATIKRAVDGLHAEYIENGVDNSNTAAALISGLGAVGENIFSDKWT
ncbi:MAG: DUF4430 domain-containing protein, partial [Caryophanon sp.]|nr:DUF4430 domain-containing protein [Caryophanon sp.]